jgi:hypothetical protein
LSDKEQIEKLKQIALQSAQSDYGVRLGAIVITKRGIDDLTPLEKELRI